MDEVKGSLNSSMICSMIFKTCGLVYISQINVIAYKPKLLYMNVFLRIFRFIEKGTKHKKCEIFVVRRISILTRMKTEFIFWQRNIDH